MERWLLDGRVHESRIRESGGVWLASRAEGMPDPGTYDLVRGDYFALQPGEWWGAYTEDTLDDGGQF